MAGAGEEDEVEEVEGEGTSKRNEWLPKEIKTRGQLEFDGSRSYYGIDTDLSFERATERSWRGCLGSSWRREKEGRRRGGGG